MTIDDEEREATRQLINGLRSGVNVAAAEIKSQREQLTPCASSSPPPCRAASGHGQHAGQDSYRMDVAGRMDGTPNRRRPLRR